MEREVKNGSTLASLSSGVAKRQVFAATRREGELSILQARSMPTQVLKVEPVLHTGDKTLQLLSCSSTAVDAELSHFAFSMCSLSSRHSFLLLYDLFCSP